MTKEEYLKNPNKCLCCGKLIMPKEGEKISNVNRRKFCGRSCSASYNNRKFPKRAVEKQYCLHCGKQLTYRHKTYCSLQCQVDYNYDQYIQRWKDGKETGIKSAGFTSNYIRRYLLRKYDNKCCMCGWDKVNPYTMRVPLELHHKDGDCTNNKEENLELLCPNCHSLTENYRSLNKGNSTRIKTR